MAVHVIEVLGSCPRRRTRRSGSAAIYRVHWPLTAALLVAFFPVAITGRCVMITVTVFRQAAPPLIGVLGVVADPASEALEQNLDWLETTGILVERFDPYREPAEVARFQTVTGFLAREGRRCLPVILVDAEVVSTGHDPTRTELARWVGRNRSASQPREELAASRQPPQVPRAFPTASARGSRSRSR